MPLILDNAVPVDLNDVDDLFGDAVGLSLQERSQSKLAVFDALGRVALVSFPISLNSPYLTRKWDADALDDVNAVAASYWLPLAHPNPQKPFVATYGPATRNGYQYHYEKSVVHAVAPSHPHLAKSALVCVTLNGSLKLFWSQNNNKLEETVIELESVLSADELVTHAAIGSDKKNLLVAVATSSRQLRLIKIEIEWAGPGSQTDKTSLPQNARLSPSLIETHLAATSWLQAVPGDAGNDASLAELSSLHLLPSVLESTGKSTAAPMIVTVRSRAHHAGSYQMAQTIIDRWEVLGEQQRNLHPAFEQLGSRRNDGPEEQGLYTRLRKLEPVILNRVVLLLQVTQHGRVLVLVMSDGTVEYRDRLSFEEIYQNEGTDRIMNLRQVGWAFSDEGLCQQVAFSPTQCSMIQLGEDGKFRWIKLHFPLGDIGNSHQDGFAQDWVNEIIRILKIQVDYSEELHHESLMRNTPLHSCLSIMNSLGFRGELQPRSFQGKLAMIEVNARNVVILITLASNTPSTGRENLSPLDDHGCGKWSVDLLSWLLDSLFGLMSDDEFTARLVSARFGEITPYLQEQNNVALHLLLSSCSRSFLLAMCRRISHLEALSTRAIEFYQRQSASGNQPRAPNSQLQQAYQRMQAITTSSPVKVHEFEKLLNALGSDIRATYSQCLPAMTKSGGNAPQGKQMDVVVKGRQIQYEMAMLNAASPPNFFLPVMKKLFGTYLPAFRNSVDPTSLFFADYEILGIQDDRTSLAAREAKGVYVDLFRRAVLKKGGQQQWRRCTRCASVMEDVSGTRPGFTFVLSQQRKCSCGGFWALLPKEKFVL
ncbi:Mediator of RNA polymerase II transcription subunit 16 [Escovopsis weberi]|uniref:Mediator of RNA polymerase II transcription subunit 16 n=1 Tax=Escovopsis weberi TaxID=150374 RepID=A0A0M8MZJ6_ESCWE|nr:Mediator of RNA polymerase II transcription subunit 16 [Escovopsis weberi]